MCILSITQEIMSDESNNRSSIFLSDEEVFDDETMKCSVATNDPPLGIQGESSDQDLASTNEALQDMLEGCHEEINAASQDTELLVNKMEELKLTISELQNVEEELESSLQLLSEEQNTTQGHGRRVVELERENRTLRQVNEVIAAKIDTLLEYQECDPQDCEVDTMHPQEYDEYESLIVNAESAMSACPVFEGEQENEEFCVWKEHMKGTIVALADYHRRRILEYPA